MNTTTTPDELHAENVEKFKKELEEIVEECPPLDALVADHVLVALQERPEQPLGDLVREEVNWFMRELEGDILTGLIHVIEHLHTKGAP